MVNERRPYFLEGFNPSSSSERLKIPPKFVKHMEGWTFGTASLVGPSGESWNAELIQLDDGLFLHDGWAAFVKDHFLESSDSLVFRYDGNLHFTVQVFDQCSCEKEEAFSAHCSQDQGNYDNHVGKKREREKTALWNDIVDGIPKRMRSSEVHSECTAKNQEADLVIADKQGRLLEYVKAMTERCQAPNILNETDSGSCPLKNYVTIAVPSESQTLNENSDAITGVTDSKEDMMMSASEAEKIARSFTSCFPNFTKLMKRFNTSGSYTLNVPYQFSMAYLPNCKVKIVLRNVKGESWTVNSIPTTRVQTSHTFCGGWLGFVRDNSISVGDTCIFELVGKCELRVQILRVKKEGTDCQCGKTGYKISGRLPKKMRGNACNEHLQRITKVGLSGKKGSAFSKSNVKHISTLKSSTLSAESKSVNRRQKSSQDKLGSHSKGCMSMKSVPEEQIAAESFISTFPHFVRIMKKFNVCGSYTLKIPYRFSMEHLPNFKTEVVLRNLKGESWTVNSIPTTKVQTLHTFCGGWMAFVRDNDLQMGDICIFELVGKCELRVHMASIGKKGLESTPGSLGMGSLTSNHGLL